MDLLMFKLDDGHKNPSARAVAFPDGDGRLVVQREIQLVYATEAGAGGHKEALFIDRYRKAPESLEGSVINDLERLAVATHSLEQRGAVVVANENLAG